MKDISLLEQVKSIAHTYEYEVRVAEMSIDPPIENWEMSNNDISLHLLIHKLGERDYIYSISSDMLPPELYPDEVRKGYTLAQRSDEILSSIQKILAREIEFVPHQGMFGKTVGYITIPIDGIITKVRLEYNFFNLPGSAAR